MYLRLAKRIECIRPSPATLTSSAIGAAAGRQFRPRASSLAEYRVHHNRGLPRPPAFQHLCLPSFRPLRRRLFGFRVRALHAVERAERGSIPSLQMFANSSQVPIIVSVEATLTRDFQNST